MSVPLIALVQALSQAAEIDQCTLMKAAADLLYLIACGYREDDSPMVYAGDDRFGRSPAAGTREQRLARRSP